MAPDVVLLKTRALVDVMTGNVLSPAYVTVHGDRIASVASALPGASGSAQVIDLGELTLLPGLMDMEVNLVLGGPGASVMDVVTDDPAERLLRAVANCRRTLRAGFTTVRNLGLFVPTRGLLLDAALSRAVDAGWIDGPGIIPAGPAITPTGGQPDADR